MLYDTSWLSSSHEVYDWQRHLSNHQDASVASSSPLHGLDVAWHRDRDSSVHARFVPLCHTRLARLQSSRLQHLRRMTSFQMVSPQISTHNAVRSVQDKTRRREVTDAGTTVPLSPHLQCRYSDKQNLPYSTKYSDRSPVPVRLVLQSNLTGWLDQNLSKRF